MKTYKVSVDFLGATFTRIYEADSEDDARYYAREDLLKMLESGLSWEPSKRRSERKFDFDGEGQTIKYTVRLDGSEGGKIIEIPKFDDCLNREVDPADFFMSAIFQDEPLEGILTDYYIEEASMKEVVEHYLQPLQKELESYKTKIDILSAKIAELEKRDVPSSVLSW